MMMIKNNVKLLSGLGLRIYFIYLGLKCVGKCPAQPILPILGVLGAVLMLLLYFLFSRGITNLLEDIVLTIYYIWLIMVTLVLFQLDVPDLHNEKVGNYCESSVYIKTVVFVVLHWVVLFLLILFSTVKDLNKKT
uniref:MARVEL domain-containing protein n=1 Tax=Strigamia maritima TaxID=126957 RepID=T1ILV3_STRMM